MKTKSSKIAVLVVAFTVAVMLLLFASSLINAKSREQENGTEKANEEGLSCLVTTTPLQIGEIEESIIAYGTVIPLQEKTVDYSFPFECKVLSVAVVTGEYLHKGDFLMEIAPSPNAKLQLEQAKNQENAAKKDMKLLEERIKLKLATKQEQLAIKSGLRLARENLQSLLARGMDKEKIIVKAKAEGVLYSLKAISGQFIAAGNTLAQVVGKNHIMVKFGVEPEDIGYLQVGHIIKMKKVYVSQKQTLSGKIVSISRMLAPDTRLVNVYAIPLGDNNLLINDFIEIKIALKSHKKVMLAPRSAVLPGENGYYLFIAVDETAVKSFVQIGIENADSLEIISSELRPGDRLIISGNYELEDGMAIVKERR